MKKGRKYELTDETVNEDGHVLHRIRALRDVADYARKGNVGGYVESDANLSHGGNSWVFNDARVYGHAHVVGNAAVSDYSRVYGEAYVCEESYINGFARVHGHASVKGHANVYGESEVYDDAKICGLARISGKARVFGNARITDHALVFGNARVYGKAFVTDNAQISGRASVCDDTYIYGFGAVCGNAFIGGNASITGSGDTCFGSDAVVMGNDDYMMFNNIWSSKRRFICFKTASGILKWSAGCFLGTGEALIEAAYEKSKLSGDCYKKVVEMAEDMFRRVREEESNGR